MLTVGSLFSGIGGLDLGLERAGMQVRWQCEIDPYCRAVLKKHWPETPIYHDAKDINDRSTTRVDVLAGGFPCQPISQAAARTDRANGWLWPEFDRIIHDLRPKWVIVENVEALRYANRGLAWVLSDLADLGFDAEWRVVRASDFGAPHKRARVWVVAHSNAHSEPALSFDDEAPLLSKPFPTLSDWGSMPDLRVADGTTSRVLRRQRLGNAVVPAVAEWVGRMILETV